MAWVTLKDNDGVYHHVLLDEGQASSAGRRIAATAKKYTGSKAWAFDKRKDDFPPYSNKCNKYVYDVTKEAGAEATVTPPGGKPRPPLAGEWADPRVDIPGWRVLGPNEMPQPGDVAAYKLRPNPGEAPYTGHSGIVTGVDADGTVHAMAAHANVVGPDDKFQRSNGAVYRRYKR